MVYGILIIGAIFSLLKLRSFQLEKEKEELEKIVHERTDEIQEKNIPGWKEVKEEMTYIEVGSHLMPYLSPEEFEIFVQEKIEEFLKKYNGDS